MIIGNPNINKNMVFAGFITGIFLLAGLARPNACAQPDKGDLTYKDANLILIAINNIGVEHMSLYGYSRKTTPELDAWSKNALVFDGVYTPASWTLPVMTTFFTSLYPYTHGIANRSFENSLSPKTEIFPYFLRSHGYNTVAFTGGLDNSKFFSHMWGFNFIADNPAYTGFKVTLKQAGEWLSRKPRKKFFLFIQGYDAHAPFTPPKKFRGIFSNPAGKDITINPDLTYRGFEDHGGQYWANYFIPEDGADNGLRKKWKITPLVEITRDDIDYMRDLYDEEVLSVDAQVANFLRSLDKNLLKNTIIIVFSEHGEMFAKHGRFGRAGTLRGVLYDDVVHVPLMIKLPGQKGRRITGLVQIVDMMPTLLELLGIPGPGNLQGKSLIPLIKGQGPVNDYIYAGASYNLTRITEKRLYMNPSINESIRSADWKLIHEIIYEEDHTGLPRSEKLGVKSETFELYDLKNDPNEFSNVFDKYPRTANALREKLEKWAQDCKNSSNYGAVTSKIPDGIIDDARKNGYW